MVFRAKFMDASSIAAKHHGLKTYSGTYGSGSDIVCQIFGKRRTDCLFGSRQCVSALHQTAAECVFFAGVVLL